MKAIVFSPDVLKKLQKIQKKDTKLFNKIHKQLLLFKQNPKHHSLRLHRIVRNVENVWSISIDKNYRMLYQDQPKKAYFFEIGTHDEVYKK